MSNDKYAAYKQQRWQLSERQPKKHECVWCRRPYLTRAYNPRFCSAACREARDTYALRYVNGDARLVSQLWALFPEPEQLNRKDK